MRALLKSPSAFFRALKLESLNNKTLLIGVGCLWFGLFFESAIQIYLASIANTLKPILEVIPLKQLELIKKEAFLSLAFSPIIAFFGIYLFASALHITIKGFGFSNSKNLTYEHTLYLCALCQTPMLFGIIPIVGPLVSSIWVFVLLIKALKQIYELSTLSAAACILPPALFLKLSWGSALQLLALSV